MTDYRLSPLLFSTYFVAIDLVSFIAAQEIIIIQLMSTMAIELTEQG